jgi:hypothetical protein
MKNEISVKRDSSQLGRLNKVFHVLSFELFYATSLLTRISFLRSLQKPA